MAELDEDRLDSMKFHGDSDRFSFSGWSLVSLSIHKKTFLEPYPTKGPQNPKRSWRFLGGQNPWFQMVPTNQPWRFAARMASLVDALDRQPAFQPTDDDPGNRQHSSEKVAGTRKLWFKQESSRDLDRFIYRIYIYIQIYTRYTINLRNICAIHILYHVYMKHITYIRSYTLSLDPL